MKSLHEINAAIVALRRLDTETLTPADKVSLDNIRTILEDNGEFFSLVLSMRDNITLSRKKDTQAQVAVSHAIKDFTELAINSGLSDLITRQAVTRAADLTGIESVGFLEQKPGSDGDDETSHDFASTVEGRSLILATLASYLVILRLGPVRHSVIRALIKSLEAAAQGKNPWPTVVTRERIKKDAGLSHLWNTTVARQVGA